MDIYFDESKNTCEISLNGNVLNYTEQRYFVLVGYIEDEIQIKSIKDLKRNVFPKLTSITHQFIKPKVMISSRNSYFGCPLS